MDCFNQSKVTWKFNRIFVVESMGNLISELGNKISEIKDVDDNELTLINKKLEKINAIIEEL